MSKFFNGSPLATEKAKKTMTSKRLIFLILVMLGVSSCSQFPEKNDIFDVMVSQECSVPCWRGITPGVTTFYEAWNIVQEMKFTNQNASGIPPDKISKNILDGYISIQFNKVFVSLSANDQGIITENHFSRISRYRWNNPKLKEFIKVYGEPESIKICHEFMEMRRAIVFIYYPDMYLYFNTFLPTRGESFNVPIEKNTRINNVTFLPSSYERPLFDFSFSWTGYGEVTITPVKRNPDSICTIWFPYTND